MRPPPWSGNHPRRPPRAFAPCLCGFAFSRMKSGWSFCRGASVAKLLSRSVRAVLVPRSCVLCCSAVSRGVNVPRFVCSLFEGHLDCSLWSAAAVPVCMRPCVCVNLGRVLWVRHSLGPDHGVLPSVGSVLEEAAKLAQGAVPWRVPATRTGRRAPVCAFWPY